MRTKTNVKRGSDDHKGFIETQVHRQKRSPFNDERKVKNKFVPSMQTDLHEAIWISDEQLHSVKLNGKRFMEFACLTCWRLTSINRKRNTDKRNSRCPGTKNWPKATEVQRNPELLARTSDQYEERGDPLGNATLPPQ